MARTYPRRVSFMGAVRRHPHGSSSHAVAPTHLSSRHAHPPRSPRQTLPIAQKAPAGDRGSIACPLTTPSTRSPLRSAKIIPDDARVPRLRRAPCADRSRAGQGPRSRGSRATPCPALPLPKLSDPRRRDLVHRAQNAERRRPKPTREGRDIDATPPPRRSRRSACSPRAARKREDPAARHEARLRRLREGSRRKGKDVDPEALLGPDDARASGGFATEAVLPPRPASRTTKPWIAVYGGRAPQ